MLIGIAVNPECFGPKVVIDEDTRRGAEGVLRASLQNALLLGCQGHDTLGEIVSASSRLRSALGQQLQVLSVEVVKSRKECLALKAPSLAKTSPVERLRWIAVNASPDVLVCASASEVRALHALEASVEICTLADFLFSAAEMRRIEWSSSTRLDRLPPGECERLLGRAVRYGEELVIADKMIGRSAKDGVSAALRRFARGVVYVAENWCEYAGVAGRRAYVKIVTQAGGSGAAAGYIDPGIARQAIRQAVQATDSKGAISKLEIELKEESTPPIFRDRFLASGRRVWGIRHGFDDIGRLSGPPERRSPTLIDPDCSSNRALLREILALREAR